MQNSAPTYRGISRRLLVSNPIGAKPAPVLHGVLRHSRSGAPQSGIPPTKEASANPWIYVLLYNGEKYIVETKIWGEMCFISQLTEYLRLEGVKDGYYVVFDHRRTPQAREEEEVVEGKTIVSFCIPVLQERPSDATAKAA